MENGSSRRTGKANRKASVQNACNSCKAETITLTFPFGKKKKNVQGGGKLEGCGVVVGKVGATEVTSTPI